MDRRPRAPVLRSIALRGDRLQRVVRDGQLHVLHLEQALVLLDERVLRLGQDLNERAFVEIFERGDHRQTADEFGDEAELQQILRLDVAQDFAGAPLVGSGDLGREADRGALAAPRDDLLEARKRAAADEQDVRRVDLQEFLLRMLAAALRRNGGDGAFHDLQAAPAARPRPIRRA